MTTRPGIALAAAAAVAFLAGCAPSAVLMTPPPTEKPPPGAGDEVTGEVAFSSGGLGARVVYGPWKLTGPDASLAYAGDGAWAGTLAGSQTRFSSSQGMIKGPSTQILVNQDGNSLHVRGSFLGRLVDFTIGKTGVQGTLERSGCTLALRPAGPGAFSGPLGCSGGPGGAPTTSDGTLLLGGEAILFPNVLLPQFVLALLLALPV
jgi:hypothetical protein